MWAYTKNKIQDFLLRTSVEHMSGVGTIVIVAAVAFTGYYIHRSITQSPAYKATSAISSLVSNPSSSIGGLIRIASLITLAVESAPASTVVKPPTAPDPGQQTRTQCTGGRVYECGKLKGLFGEDLLFPKLCNEPIKCEQVPV